MTNEYDNHEGPLEDVEKVAPTLTALPEPYCVALVKWAMFTESEQEVTRNWAHYWIQQILGEWVT